MKPSFVLRSSALAGAALVCAVLVYTAQRPEPSRVSIPGALDPTFAPAAFNNSIYTIAAQPKGRILVGGVFTLVNDRPHWLVAALTPAGELDPGFQSGLTTNDLSIVRAILPLAEGAWLIGGDTGVLKMGEDGSLDPHFRVPTDGLVTSLRLLANGEILVGGRFLSIAGHRHPGVARIHRDGSLDTSFGPVAAIPSEAPCLVTATLPSQPDGFLLAGQFQLPGRAETASLIRIGSNGEWDEKWEAKISGEILDMALQPDGKILLAGTYLGRHRGLARLLTSGALDESFDAGITEHDPAVARVICVPDGRILACGPRLGSLREQPLAGLAVLRTDGSPDPSFMLEAGALFRSNTLELLPNGQILLLSTACGESKFPKGLVRLHGLRINK